MMKPAFSYLPTDARFAPDAGVRLGVAPEGIAYADSEKGADIARRVGEEILHKRFDPGIWAEALASSWSGDKDITAVYARLRIRQLSDQRQMKWTKEQSHENRRRTACLASNRVRDMAIQTWHTALPRVSPSLIGILMVGSCGLALSAARLYGGILPEAIERWAFCLALVFGAGIVGGILSLRLLLRRKLVMACWNEALMLTCIAVCFGSLYCGWKLLGRTRPDVIQSLVSRKPPFQALRPASDPETTGELIGVNALRSIRAVEQSGR